MSAPSLKNVGILLCFKAVKHVYKPIKKKKMMCAIGKPVNFSM
jgi:hypothetical protein